MDRFDEALHFAIKAHAGMFRKGGAPYIVHPLEVAVIASTMTQDEDVLCAAVLHDVVEDTPATLQDIVDAFGERVGELVGAETEDKHRERPPEDTWYMRKRDSLEVLRSCDDRDVLILWLADKLSNMRSFVRMHEVSGNRLWEAFHEKDPRIQAWYYNSIAQATSELSDMEAWKEYSFLLDKVFEGVG